MAVGLGVAAIGGLTVVAAYAAARPSAVSTLTVEPTRLDPIAIATVPAVTTVTATVVAPESIATPLARPAPIPPRSPARPAPIVPLPI